MDNNKYKKEMSFPIVLVVIVVWGLILIEGMLKTIKNHINYDNINDTNSYMNN